MTDRVLPIKLTDEDQSRLADIQKALAKEREGKVSQAAAIRYALKQAAANLRKAK